MSDLNPEFLAGLAKLETANGQKAIKGTNNLYNIKDFSGGGVRAHDKAEGSNDAYRVYASHEESTADLMGLLRRKYPRALTATTGQEFAQALKDGGYATDPNYVEKLSNVIKAGSFDGSQTQARVSYNNFTQPMPPKQTFELASKPATGPQEVNLQDTPVALTAADSTRAVQREQQDEFELASNTGIGDVARAKFMHEGVGPILKRMVRPDFDDVASPGYVVEEKALAGLTEDEQDHIRAARSEKEEGFLRWEMEQRRNDDAVAARRGAGAQFLGSALAGLPVDYATGMGVARVFALGKIAQGASKTGAIGRTVAENAIGGGVTGAVNLVIDPYYGTSEFAMEVAGSAILGSALQVPGVWHAADKGAAKARFREMAEASARRSVELHERATANLGPDATPEALAGEMRRLEADRIAAATNRGGGYVDPDRRLLPEDPELRVDEPEATAPAGEAPTPADPLKEAQERAIATAEAEADDSLTPQEKATKEAMLGEWSADKAQQDHIDRVNGIDRPATDAALKSAKTVEERAAAWRWHSEKPLWDTVTPEIDQQRINNLRVGPVAKNLATIEGIHFGWIAKQTAVGVKTLPEFEKVSRYAPIAEAVVALRRKFLPNSRIALGIDLGPIRADGTRETPAHNAVVYSGGNNHVIGVRKNMSTTMALESTIHEVGHAIFHEYARHIEPGLLARMVAEHAEFLKEVRAGKTSARFKRYREGGENVVDKDGALRGKMPVSKYIVDFDEYTAEAFVRYMQRKAREGSADLPTEAVSLLKQAWEKVKQLYEYARTRGWLAKDVAFSEFFDLVAAGGLKRIDAVSPPSAKPGMAQQSARTPPSVRATFAADPAAIRNGLDNMPTQTVGEQAEAKAVLSLYKKATAGTAYKADEKRLSTILNTAAFHGAQGTANVMARSANPVVRMVAAELLESASGASGRRSSAAIAKYLNEQAYLGNTLNEFQGAYVEFRKSQGENIAGDFFSGKVWEQYNRMVAAHIESLRPGATPVSSPPAVMKGAALLEKAYERIRKAQTDTKTIGWASLPPTSTGYMPHRMSAEKFRNLTLDQERVLHGALVDQFIGIEGFDITFSQGLASKYMDRVRRSGLGGFEAPMGIHQVGAADIVQAALNQMGLTREEVTRMMKRYMAGGAGHTKRRLQLDLNAEHPMPDGTMFKLMDVFETDQFKLLRKQAQRVAGEVALANHGIMGSAGLKLLRRAMEFGAAGERATAKEVEAFDQVAAEFLGDNFGTQNKLVDRAMQVTSLSRLGGMGFTQLAEALNGVFHVGALRTLGSVFSIGRLRSEIKALARGEKVDNPIIGSLEQYRGAEFGTESYKTVFPFDNQSLEYQTYGKDTITAADRLLRGGQWVQGKLSLWRTMHSTQQRGMAEQIVRKAAQYLRDGTNDAALRDMGITDELAARMRADIGSIAQFDGNKLTNFDITKARDLKAAEEFTQAVHRGVSQIIQGTFIGERGAWAHDGMLRMLTQFRTFSLTSVEKQWGRQVGNVGTAKALGMVVGSMSMAAPIYMARTYLASIGREDQQDYLEKQLTPARIARASLNYIAMSGLSGDFLDAASAVSGIGSTTGGRVGGSDFVGAVVAPAAGVANDLWKGLQNTKEGSDPTALIKALPFSRLPYLIPAINSLGD